MTCISQPQSGYSLGLESALYGELAAEQVYRALAQRSAHPGQRAKFDAIADIERLTAHTLEPVARRQGVQVEDTKLAVRIERRLAELSPLSWDQFIAEAATDWPPYITLFERLACQAPPEDADAMRLLIAHERALVRFIELEQAFPGGTKSLQPLQSLLALMPRVPPPTT